MNNVTQLNPTQEPSTEELLAIAHKNGAARAVHSVKHTMEDEHKRLSGEDSSAVKAATNAFESKLDPDQALRDKAEADKPARATLVRVNKIHWDTCDGKADRDELATEADTDRKARKSKIDAFGIAEDELLQQRTETDQTSFGFGTVNADDGALGFTTKATSAVVYAALMYLQSTGVSLDEYQSAVLAELSSSGVDVMDLGMAAAEAVEHDEDEETVPEGSEDDHPF